MTLLILCVATALAVSFLCSLLEASRLSLSPSVVQAAKTGGARWADRMTSLKQNVDRPLAAS